MGLILLSPLFLVLAVLVKWSDGGPVFYRQERVGLGGRLFRILKFRSMVIDADRLGIAVTRDGDPRITGVGRFLRKTKLDELPQLWNVFVGEMSLVGPRPEVPQYVARYTEAQRAILELKPGITDLATLRFRNEEALLRAATDTERFYLEHCVPRKIELNLAYARRAGIWSDTVIIMQTLLPWLERRSE
jgi:lipopolysaccharide/colanic/teichoic acid biosynthesis glycosyltransferase